MTAFRTLSFAGALCLLGVPAKATLIVTPTGGKGGDNAISIPECSGKNETGTSVTGCLNSNHDVPVVFQSTENGTQESLQFFGSGQARLIAAGGASADQPSGTWGFDNVTISLGGKLVFSQITLNVEVYTPTKVTFYDDHGEVSDTFELSGKGNGDFTVSSTYPYLSWLRVETGDRFVSYPIGRGKDRKNVVVADGDISGIKQVRFDGVKTRPIESTGNTKVPEPASLFILLAGLIGAGVFRRRVRAGTRPPA